MKQFETKIAIIHNSKYVVNRDPYDDGEDVYNPDVNPDGKTVTDQVGEYGEAGWQVVHVFHWDSEWARILFQREKQASPYRD